MLSRSFFAPVLLLLPLTAVACVAESAPADSERIETEGAAATVDPPAFTVNATWRSVVTGTPTYGTDGTSPVVRIRLEVDDASLAKAHPGFDGLERPFVLVPRAEGERVVWDRVALEAAGQTRRGYYAERVIDLYETYVRDGVDLTTVLREGVAVGADTNVGQIWAQAPGENVRVTQAR